VWFLIDHERLARERKAIAELGQRAPWLEVERWAFRDNHLSIEATITVDSKSYPIHLVFPETYPAGPPIVRPRDEARWSEHQYADGELCLDRGPDNWHPDHDDGAVMLESAHRLLSLESARATAPETEIPSRHKLTLGQDMRFQYSRLALTSAGRDALNRLTGAVLAKLHCVWHKESCIAFLASLGAGSNEWRDPFVPEFLGKVGHEKRAVACPSHGNENILSELKRPGSVETLVAQQVAAPDPAPGAVLVDDSGAWHLFWSLGHTKKPVHFSTLMLDTTPGEARTGVERDALKAKVVSIIGLGSVGSKVAITLCRSGIQQFVLVDDDLIQPSNLVRHAGDWRDVAEHKVRAVAEHLNLIDAGVQVKSRMHRLGGQEAASSTSTALTALMKSDLIIDATANPRVFNQCAQIAKRWNVPMAWAEVFTGGIGGLIARARPGRDADPYTLRSALLSFCAKQNQPVPTANSDDYGATSQDDRWLIAGDAEVSVVAANLSMLAIDTLVGARPSRFPYSLYLMAFDRAWIFEQPFQVIPIECTSAGAWGALPGGDDPEMIKRNLELLQEILRDDTRPPRNPSAD
jgi:ubiquitin-protein ligase